MLDRLGIDYETKLKDKRPFERFMYIIGCMKKDAKEKNLDVSIYDIRNIRKVLKKNLGIKSHMFTLIETDKVDDVKIYEEYAKIAGVSREVLLKDSQFASLLDEKKVEIPDTDKPKVTRAKRVEKSSDQDSGDCTLVFENCTDFHLSLEANGKHIRVYLNEHAPKTAKHVLLSTQIVRIGDKDVKKTFPETIKIE